MTARERHMLSLSLEKRTAQCIMRISADEQVSRLPYSCPGDPSPCQCPYCLPSALAGCACTRELRNCTPGTWVGHACGQRDASRRTRRARRKISVPDVPDCLGRDTALSRRDGHWRRHVALLQIISLPKSLVCGALTPVGTGGERVCVGVLQVRARVWMDAYQYRPATPDWPCPSRLVSPSSSPSNFSLAVPC